MNEKTNGEVKIEFYPAEQLGTASEQVDSMETGTQDIVISTLDWLSALEEDYNVLSMPYVFNDMEHFKKFLNSPIHQEMKDNVLENHGIRVLADNLYRSPRVLETTVPIETPEDVKGMKLRTPDLPIFIEHVKQMEAIPVQIAWGETYLGLQQNLAKGLNPTMETIYSSKFHEVAPYIAELNHSFSSAFILMADSPYQKKLDSEQQKAVKEAAIEAGEFHDEIVKEQLAEEKEQMIDEGATFTTPDRELFKEKVLPMAEKLEEEGMWSKGLVEKIQQLD